MPRPFHAWIDGNKIELWADTFSDAQSQVAKLYPRARDYYIRRVKPSQMKASTP